MNRYWTGILLILFGGMFLLDNLGIMEFHFMIRKFWPVALVLVGVSMLIKGRKRKT